MDVLSRRAILLPLERRAGLRRFSRAALFGRAPVSLERPHDLVARLQLEHAEALVDRAPALDPVEPVLLTLAAALVLQVVDLREEGRFALARVLEGDPARVLAGLLEGLEDGHALHVGEGRE